jgi:hypothetical protein
MGINGYQSPIDTSPMTSTSSSAAVAPATETPTCRWSIPGHSGCDQAEALSYPENYHRNMGNHALNHPIDEKKIGGSLISHKHTQTHFELSQN